MLLDAFMKLEDPKEEGESTDKLHLKEIEIFSFEQTINRNAKGATGGTSSESKAKSEHKPLTVIKPLDKTSPKLLQAASEGKLYKKVTISVGQPSGTTKTASSTWKKIVYLKITLEQVHISRIHLVGDAGMHFFGRANEFPVAAGDLLSMGPVEEVDLSYKKIQWLYKGGTGKLNISGKWNLLTNTAT